MSKPPKVLSQKQYLQFKVEKFELEALIASTELEIFETQKYLIKIKKLYKKKGFSQYPTFRKELQS